MVQKKKEEEENMKLHARSYIRISTSPQRRQRPWPNDAEQFLYLQGPPRHFCMLQSKGTQNFGHKTDFITDWSSKFREH